MNSIIGFSLFHNVEPSKSETAIQVQDRALGIFKHLKRASFLVGNTRLDLWGHNLLEERMQRLPDGSLLALIGSPLLEGATLEDAGARLLDIPKRQDFKPPWEGRFLLLWITADGECWTMWNDWLGSIPVFHAQIGQGRLASTLEPVTVAAAGYTPDDFFLPGLVSLLINGHYLSDWTLYQGMRVIPPDSVMDWDEKGFRAQQLRTVEPSQSRWEASLDDLVDEMHALSYQATADILKTQPTWILPLSSGLDSRLIAGVAAEVGVNAHTYAWGEPHSTDVAYSRQIAKTLGYPWKHIDLPRDFLVKYTPHWAALFGSAMHFHGMYQMCFLDEIASEPSGPVISGFVGDVLAGDSVNDLDEMHLPGKSYQLESDWYCHWTVDEVRSLAKFPLQEALEANADELRRQIDALPGAFYQKLQFLELRNRQRHFTSFQSTLSDYWRGVANPFLNRAYARFCLSIPRMALDNRHLLSSVFRRYYGRLAVIPGTYAPEPYILTGRFLLLRRIANSLIPAFHRGPLSGFGNVQLRMDITSVQSTGRESLWPLFGVFDKLRSWVDVGWLERDFETILHSQKDIRPLRRLQSVQALAYRLMN